MIIFLWGRYSSSFFSQPYLADVSTAATTAYTSAAASSSAPAAPHPVTTTTIPAIVIALMGSMTQEMGVRTAPGNARYAPRIIVPDVPLDTT